MPWELTPHREIPDQWNVELYHPTSNRMSVVTFSGKNAEELAKEYQRFKNMRAQFKHDEPEDD